MFRLSVDTGNAAFDDDYRNEVARILRAAADAIDASASQSSILRDINGNAVGAWNFNEET